MLLRTGDKVKWRFKDIICTGLVFEDLGGDTITVVVGSFYEEVKIKRSELEIDV